MAPETPRISIHDYIDARLDEQDERIKHQMLKNTARIKIDAWETRAWFLMLSAPAWGDFSQDWVNHEAGVALAFVVAVAGLLGIYFFRTHPANAHDPAVEDEI